MSNACKEFNLVAGIIQAKNSELPKSYNSASTSGLKSLELLNSSLSSIIVNIQELTLFPRYKVRLNTEALLTFHVENKHAITHFKRLTFTVHECAMKFGTPVKEAVKSVFK